MSDTKPKRFHRYQDPTHEMQVERWFEAARHHNFLEWRRRIEAREPGSIAFAPEAK